MSKDLIAIALMSGGLDSALAAAVVMEWGAAVIGIWCDHPFHPDERGGARPHAELVAKELGIELVKRDVTEKMIETVKSPAHGYGKHLNPCVDCRILYLAEARELMEERGAHFLVTGEVLGQRPMSQRRDSMDIIDRDSGLRGLIVRPLCGKFMRPTIPEQKGWIEREKLLDIDGRGRKRQIELAGKFSVKEYASPAGGCLLTMEDFARKMKDLIGHGEVSRADVELLKVGRRLRLSDKAILVLGKNEGENRRLENMVLPGDAALTTIDVPGPFGLIRGKFEREDLELACSILLRYVRPTGNPIPVLASTGDERITISASPMGRADAKRYLI